jgi:hypothetical protein
MKTVVALCSCVLSVASVAPERRPDPRLRRKPNDNSKTGNGVQRQPIRGHSLRRSVLQRSISNLRSSPLLRGNGLHTAWELRGPYIDPIERQLDRAERSRQHLYEGNLGNPQQHRDPSRADIFK